MSVSFVESVKRCTGNATFSDRFYDQLLSRNPALCAHLAHVDAFHHKYLLSRLLMALVRHSSHMSGADRSLASLARDYAAIGLPERYYRDWLEALLLTVREVDRAMPPEVAAEWRKRMSDAVGDFIVLVRRLGPMAADW